MTMALALMILFHADSTLSLAGQWQFALDPTGVGVSQGWSRRTLDDTILLPTTTDAARKGPEQPPIRNTGSLTRRHPYEGPAWYHRTFVVPPTWSGRQVALSVERTKALTVFLEGGLALDGGRNLSTSHVVPLGALAPGEHTLTLRVDNRLSLWPDRVSASHMLEESTQTDWNGVLGRIELRTEERYGIDGVRAGAVGGDPHRLGVRAYLARAVADPEIQATLTQNGLRIGTGTAKGDSLEIAVAKDAALWDEFHPDLCRLTVLVTGQGFRSQWEGMVGLRDFRGRGGHLLVNGRRTFLRGRHDACVFPLTGCPPMDEAGWARYFGIVKGYGLNHVRFHSWCPPDAAFEAADRMGVYLQPELPFWGDPGKPGVEPFLTHEGLRVLKDYGHHPSFVMLSLGNEYWGDPAPRGRMVAALRGLDPTRMYDQGSNVEWWNPREFPGDDYRVGAFAMAGEAGKLRGSYAVDKDRGVGYIQTHVAGTLHTYSEGLAGKTLPFVSHEVGQYQVFPDFRETAKYTGVLRADNFAVFQERLAQAGMLDQAEQFREASGRLAVQCYREEIEAALRTPEMDGFQLLDIQDYPGQGTALVGILDAFMDSKGLITEAGWRSFCSDFVPLAMFPKYTWRTDETFQARIRVSNYGPDAVNSRVTWKITQGGRVLARGPVRRSRSPRAESRTSARSPARWVPSPHRRGSNCRSASAGGRRPGPSGSTRRSRSRSRSRRWWSAGSTPGRWPGWRRETRSSTSRPPPTCPTACRAPRAGPIPDPVLFGVAVAGPGAPLPRRPARRSGGLPADRPADRQLRPESPPGHAVRTESRGGPTVRLRDRSA
jgi:hypothetical protein